MKNQMMKAATLSLLVGRTASFRSATALISHNKLYSTTVVLHMASEPIYTPKSDIPYNFGPCSLDDEVLFTAERPGNPVSKEGAIPIEDVKNWIKFMTEEKGIAHVMCLLDENEFDVYSDPGLLKLYEEGGLDYTVQSMSEEGAFQKIVDKLKEIEGKGLKSVAHCTGGTGRAGRVAAGWLAARYGLSPSEATQKAVDAAIETGVHRLGNEEKLAKWME